MDMEWKTGSQEERKQGSYAHNKADESLLINALLLLVLWPKGYIPEFIDKNGCERAKLGQVQ